jgi:hypothetical protein
LTIPMTLGTRSRAGKISRPRASHLTNDVVFTISFRPRAGWHARPYSCGASRRRLAKASGSIEVGIVKPRLFHHIHDLLRQVLDDVVCGA